MDGALVDGGGLGAATMGSATGTQAARGSSTWKMEPRPGALATAMVPPLWWTMP